MRFPITSLVSDPSLVPGLFYPFSTEADGLVEHRVAPMILRHLQGSDGVRKTDSQSQSWALLFCPKSSVTCVSRNFSVEAVSTSGIKIHMLLFSSNINNIFPHNVNDLFIYLMAFSCA